VYAQNSPDEADREPELVGLSQSFEDLVEVGDLADERDGADREEHRNRHASKCLAFVEPVEVGGLPQLSPERSGKRTRGRSTRPYASLLARRPRPGARAEAP
jgi:hypothetical protein